MSKRNEKHFSKAGTCVGRAYISMEGLLLTDNRGLDHLSADSS